MSKYIPHIIPENNRVLPEYFKSSKQKNSSGSSNILSSFISILLIISSLGAFTIHFWFGFMLLISAFIISPWGHSIIESNLKFTLESSLKFKVLSIISVFGLFLGKQFFDEVGKISEQNKIIEVKEIAKNNVIQKKEKERSDSLIYFISEAEKYKNSKKYKKAINFFNYATKYTKGGTDVRITNGLADSFFDSKDYLKALQKLLIINDGSSDNYFRMGICSKKLGKIQESIQYFKSATDLGHPRAEREYNKINPILKHILYYQTVCCDGSYSPSNAKGRGACSHHGGVCNWDKPIFEEYRKY